MLSDKIVEPYPYHKNVIMREKKKTNGDYVELSYALMANKNKLIPNRRKTSFKKLQEKNKNTLIFEHVVHHFVPLSVYQRFYSDFS